jgi:hypothetical protein
MGKGQPDTVCAAKLSMGKEQPDTVHVDTVEAQQALFTQSLISRSTSCRDSLDAIIVTS